MDGMNTEINAGTASCECIGANKVKFSIGCPWRSNKGNLQPPASQLASVDMPARHDKRFTNRSLSGNSYPVLLQAHRVTLFG